MSPCNNKQNMKNQGHKYYPKNYSFCNNNLNENYLDEIPDKEFKKMITVPKYSKEDMNVQYSKRKNS